MGGEADICLAPLAFIKKDEGLRTFGVEMLHILSPVRMVLAM